MLQLRETISMTTFIETPRLIIKSLDENDYPAFKAQQKDAHITECFPSTRDDVEADKIFNLLLESQEKYGFSFGMIYIKETGELIGRSGLVHLDFQPVPDVELGYFIYQQYCNKGYATELGKALITYVFDVLKLPKVYATVDPENIASCRVSEKLGMTIEKEDVYETLGKKVRFYVKYK